VPDAVELRVLHGDRMVVLADGGAASYDLDTGLASAERAEPYDPAAIDAPLRAVEFHGFDYEREIVPLPSHALPLLPVQAAAKR